MDSTEDITKVELDPNTPLKPPNIAKSSKAEPLQEQHSISSTSMSKTAIARDHKKRVKAAIVLKHVDVIKDDFWLNRPWVLSGRTS